MTYLGKIKGEKILKLHRLWELYLIEYLNNKSKYKHYNIEFIEYIITPIIKKKLKIILKNYYLNKKKIKSAIDL